LSRFSTHLPVRVFVFVLLIALSFVGWTNLVRLRQHARLAELTRSEAAMAPDSVTGYRGTVRERVQPDRDNESYGWIAEAQQMLAGGPIRVRTVVDENAPFGRPSHAASIYRGWLGSLSWIEHAISGKSLGLAVDAAAAFCDPLLHILAVLLVSLCALRFAGPLAGALSAVAGAGLFPFASRFLPGTPDDATLSVVCLLGSILPLVTALGDRDAKSNARPEFSFSTAGIIGGLGFWINPAHQLVTTLGISLGAAAGIAMTAKSPGQSGGGRHWRTWSLAGAATVFLAYLMEYFPAHLGGWEMRSVHPIYAVTWLGLGEGLARLTEWKQKGQVASRRNFVISVVLVVGAIFALPGAMWLAGNRGFLALDPLFFRLTSQPEGVNAQNVVDWIREYGANGALVATCLPILILIRSSVVLVRRRKNPAARDAILVTLVPALIFLGLACFQIRQWLLFDAALLPVVVATTFALSESSISRRDRWLWVGVVVVALVPGIFWQWPGASLAKDVVLARSQAIGLVERDLAHWLSKRAQADGRPIVLAAPKVTTSLNYYGNLRGLATLSWENQDGLSFALRVAISTSRDETAALLRSRGVNYIVLTSWDAFFEPYVHAASVQSGELFFAGLSRWNLPLWLKPIPYQLPAIAGFEKQWVKIFEVVDDQSAALAASELAEYFIEIGDQPQNVRAAYQALLRYPADFGAQIARAEVLASLGDADGFAAVLEPLIDRVSKGGDRYLPWERRVRFALVLAQGNRMDLAQTQIARCVGEIDETRLRSLSTVSLYRFLKLGKAFDLEWRDANLRPLALSLLPESMREGL
jgi:hypothetical protein